MHTSSLGRAHVPHPAGGLWGGTPLRAPHRVEPGLRTLAHSPSPQDWKEKYIHENYTKALAGKLVETVRTGTPGNKAAGFTSHTCRRAGRAEGRNQLAWTGRGGTFLCPGGAWGTRVGSRMLLVLPAGPVGASGALARTRKMSLNLASTVGCEPGVRSECFFAASGACGPLLPPSEGPFPGPVLAALRPWMRRASLSSASFSFSSCLSPCSMETLVGTLGELTEGGVGQGMGHVRGLGCVGFCRGPWRRGGCGGATLDTCG